MGANAVTTVPVYTASEVLTAADMNITNSGIPVFATTVTRDAAFGGAGEKTLAEGQFAYIEATNTTQYYDGAAWQPVGASALTLIKSQTIGTAVTSVAVTDAFNATYDNYFITINGGVGSTDINLSTILTGSTANYYQGRIVLTYSTAAVAGGAVNNGSSWEAVGTANTSTIFYAMNISSPFLAKYTYANATYYNGSGSILSLNEHRVNTSYSGFTIGTNGMGNLTGGTIRVYGYANS